MPDQLDLLPLEPADPLDRGLIAYCRAHRLPPVLSDTLEAGDTWGANCGPMALAAVLGLPTVEAVREFVQPFRGFMSPTDMRQALDRAGARHRDVDPPIRSKGLIRIQWVGPWLDLQDPRAAYRYTHWVAAEVPSDSRSMAWFLCRDASVRAEQAGRAPTPEIMIYDATPNRWVPIEEWARWCPSLYPKRATGWRMATAIEVAR